VYDLSNRQIHASTGEAALRIGRKFVGIELEPRFFDQACERKRYYITENAQRQRRLIA
jgi:DNA modification methylase